MSEKKELTGEQAANLKILAATRAHPWLSFACSDDAHSELASHPWRLGRDTVATSGKTLLCVRDLDVGFPEVPEKWAARTRQMLQKDHTIAPWGKVESGVLHAFVAPACDRCLDVGGGDECKECHGEGYVACETCEHESECKDCGGRGRYRRCPACKKESATNGTGRRECRIAELVIDRNLISVLPVQYAGEILVSYATGVAADNGRALLLSGKSVLAGELRDWLYLVCEIAPFSPGKEPGLIPVLPLEAP